MVPSRILVRAPNWIGDHILARDFYAGLRGAFPQARVTLACPAEWAELACLDFEDVAALTKPRRRVGSGLGFWATHVRAKRFDLFVGLPASWSSAVLARAAGIPERVGFAEPGAGWWLTRSLPWLGRASGKHKAQLYRDLLTLLTPASAPEGTPVAREPGRNDTIVLAPGASIALREWPHFVELAQALRARFPDAPFVVVGTAEQQDWAEKLLALGDPLLQSAVGKTSLLELVAICKTARFVIANDSGVAHVAASLAGAPTVVLFGPGDPSYVAPRGSLVARADVPCSPCESARCRGPFGWQYCLRSLQVEEVLRQVATLN